MKLYLVTGFLGAGKTTFLKNLIQLFSHEKLALIINEFGKEGVDGTLLSELDVQISEINNGSIFCSCRLDKFEEVLDHMVTLAPDVAIVEASGLSDPTNIRKILDQNLRFQSIDYRGSICMVDAVNFEKVYRMAKVCKNQISISDLVLINKCDIATKEQLEKTKDLLQTQNPTLQIKCTSFGKIEPQWVTEIEELRSTKTGDGGMHTRDITLQKHLITILDGFTCFTMKKFLEMFVSDTYRIKGFVRLDEGVYLLDCVQNMVKMELYTGKLDEDQLQKIVVLSGNGMPVKKGIQEAVKWYPHLIDHVE